jgi:hypothetical protein
MRLKNLLMGISLAAGIAAAAVAWAVDAQSLARLKRAGVEDATLELMIQERTLETAAFTVEELVALKAAGVGEETVRVLIREGSFMRGREPVVYGRELRSIRLTTAEDVIRLKQAGVSDELLQAIVEASRSGEDAERDRVLRRLQEMGVWVELPR